MDSIETAINKEGFALECKTLKVFDELGFIARQNYATLNNLNIDVFAYPGSNHNEYNSIFIVECKGSSSNNILCLMDESKSLIDEKPNDGVFGNLPRHRILEVLGYKCDNEIHYFEPSYTRDKITMVCSEEPGHDYITFRYCYTGDFRSNKPPYKKSSKQNNIYKGVLQLLAATANLKEKIVEIGAQKNVMMTPIMPIIVTNTKICIFSENDIITEVDWAIYNCNGITSADDNQLGIKYVYVVNINMLPEFIKKMG